MCLYICIYIYVRICVQSFDPLSPNYALNKYTSILHEFCPTTGETKNCSSPLLFSSPIMYR